MPKQDIFKMSQSGYTIFRLPAVVYHNGTFLTFCEGRYGCADSSVADIVLRRGILKDSKISWGDLQVIAHKTNVRMHNHVPLVDQQKNTIYLLYKDSNRSLFVTKSTDLGKSWSDVVDITIQIFKTAPNNTRSFSPGPGHGIQLDSGRLIFQGYMIIEDEAGATTSQSCVIMSDDHGSTWSCGSCVPSATTQGTGVETNEAAVAALGNNTVCLNSRTLGKDQPRAQSFSYDGGKTFGPPQLVSKLIEPKNVGADTPAGCEGGLLGFQPPSQNSQPWVLFSNPASRWLRLRMSVRLSKDRCKTWSKPYQIRWFASGYSDLTQYDDVGTMSNNNSREQSNPTFAIVYENGYIKSCSQVTFQTFTLKEILRGTS